MSELDQLPEHQRTYIFARAAVLGAETSTAPLDALVTRGFRDAEELAPRDRSYLAALGEVMDRGDNLAALDDYADGVVRDLAARDDGKVRLSDGRVVDFGADAEVAREAVGQVSLPDGRVFEYGYGSGQGQEPETWSRTDAGRSSGAQTMAAASSGLTTVERKEQEAAQQDVRDLAAAGALAAQQTQVPRAVRLAGQFGGPMFGPPAPGSTGMPAMNRRSGHEPVRDQEQGYQR
jgi:hypothetical protein